MKDKAESFCLPDKMPQLTQYYCGIMLCLFLIFPIVNTVRRLCGDSNILFDLWRDYIYYLVGGFFVILLLAFWFMRTNNDFQYSDLKKKLLGNPAWIFLGLLAVWMILSVSVTGFVYDSVIGTEKSHTGLLCSLEYCTVFVIALFVKKKKLIRLWTSLFLSVGFIVSFLIVFDYYVLGFKINFVDSSIIFYNSNHLSYFLLMVTVCAYMVYLVGSEMKIRIPAFIVYVFGAAALMIANTVGCLIALILSYVLGAIVLLLSGKFKWIRFLTVIFTVCLIYLILVFVPNPANMTLKSWMNANKDFVVSGIKTLIKDEEKPDDLGNGRLVLWKCAFQSSLEKPLFGCGLAEMRFRLMVATNGVNNTVHNEFLEFSSNHGIPALIFYLGFVMSVFIRGAKHRKELTEMNVISLCVAFAYLASSFVGVSMFYTAPYLYIFLAFGYFRRESDPLQEDKKLMK